jgi:ABC-2 type transport system permease protein
VDKLITVAWREFLATIRTKAFVLSVLLMPGLIMVSALGAGWAQKIGQSEKLPVRRIAVVDHTGVVFEPLLARVAEHNAERPQQRLELERVAPGAPDEPALRARVLSGDLYAYLILAADAVETDAGCVLARHDSQFETGRRIESMVNEAVVAARLRSAGLNPAQLAALQRPVPLRALDPKTGQPVGGDDAVRMLTPYAFMFLLFIGTFAISQGLLTSLIEEKSSRVVEVLLSAVSPTQLMAGKILGTVLVGFVLLAIWGGVGVLAAHSYNVAELVTGYRLTLALLYFVPGFLLISSLLAAVGSACNELKDAQGMVFPLSVITIIPMIFGPYFVEFPASVLSIVLSYVPPITPFIMVLRICADPDTPAWQIVTTLALLWAAVGATVWAAGKVFRTGVLMYGKPPSLRELLHWVRYS